MWVNQDGKIKSENSTESSKPIMRWSLLKTQSTAIELKSQFSPDAEVINDGDKVYLYCHSMGGGYFGDLNHPPWNGALVRYKQGEERLGAFGFSYTKDGGWPTSVQYDENAMSVSQMLDLYQSDNFVTYVMAGTLAAVQKVTGDLGWQYGAQFTVRFV